MTASRLLPRGQAHLTLRIEQCASPTQGDEIKALFQRNDRSGFATFFDRAYPGAYEAGGGSWIARDRDGDLVGHLSVFPRRFRDATRARRGALFMDLLFDAAHRNFWSAVTLVRRVVDDLRAAAGYDFAYTDPTPAARPVLQAVGFCQTASFQRFVVPLQSLYLWFCRRRARVEPMSAGRLERSWEPRARDLLSAWRPGGFFRAERSLALYGARLGGESMVGEWLSLGFGRGARFSDAALVLLATKPGRPDASVVDVLWDEGRVTLESVLVGTAAAARAAGYRKLSVVTLGGSELARTFTRAGFVSRGVELPLLTLRLNDAADLPPPRHWWLTSFDSSTW